MVTNVLSSRNTLTDSDTISTAKPMVDTAKMPAESRAVVLQCLPEVAAGFARLGLDGLPGIRLVTARDQ